MEQRLARVVGQEKAGIQAAQARRAADLKQLGGPASAKVSSPAQVPSLPKAPSRLERIGLAVLDEPICFAAGTPLLTPGGSKSIEEFEAGDLVLSRAEDDPSGIVEPRRVVRTFVRTGELVELVVEGRSILTTAEHPSATWNARPSQTLGRDRSNSSQSGRGRRTSCAE